MLRWVLLALASLLALIVESDQVAVWLLGVSVSGLVFFSVAKTIPCRNSAEMGRRRGKKARL